LEAGDGSRNGLVVSEQVFLGYLSDVEVEDEEVDVMVEGDDFEAEMADDEAEPSAAGPSTPRPAFQPPLKRRKLDVPVRAAREHEREKKKRPFKVH
jgi:hypothetical protein